MAVQAAETGFQSRRPSSSGWDLRMCTCAEASTCNRGVQHPRQCSPVIHFNVMWLRGTVHVNKWVSLLCICLYSPRDGFRKKNKPCIFSDRAVRHHQAIKTIHHLLIYILLSVTFQNIVCIDRWQSVHVACRQTDRQTSLTHANKQTWLIAGRLLSISNLIFHKDKTSSGSNLLGEKELRICIFKTSF